MQDGWVKIHRKIFNGPWNAETLALFVYLIANASYEDGECYGVKIMRGQMLTGRKKLASALEISEWKVERKLNGLEKTGKIAQQTNTKNRIITILNYDMYQSDAQQPHNKRTTNAQQTHTFKKLRNKNKEEYIEENHSETVQHKVNPEITLSDRASSWWDNVSDQIREYCTDECDREHLTEIIEDACEYWYSHQKEKKYKHNGIGSFLKRWIGFIKDDSKKFSDMPPKVLKHFEQLKNEKPDECFFEVQRAIEKLESENEKSENS